MKENEEKKGWTHSWPENEEKPATFSADEVKAYAIAVPNLAGMLPWTMSRKHIKDSQKLLNYAKKLDGFLGIHPVPPRGTLLVFRSLNEAKRARNLLANDLKINQIGDHITEIFIPKQYAQGGK